MKGDGALPHGFVSASDPASPAVPAHARLASIDGLRAIAMTLVIAQHCGLAPMGWTGVWLFYVISGFVITRNFEASRNEARGEQYGVFLRRRFFRIVPAYLLYIAVNLVVMVGVSRLIGLRDAPFLLSFTYNWQMIFQIWPTPDGWSPFGHLWTLSVEEQFYLVFPVLFLFLPRRGFMAAALALVFAGPLIRLVFASSLPESLGLDPLARAFAVYAASITQFDAFLIGALVALFERQLRTKPVLAPALVASAAVALGAYAATMILVNRSHGAAGIDLVRNIFSGILAGDGREALVYSVVDLACAALVASALVLDRVAKPLSWRPLSFIGRISYGGYLVHLLVLWSCGHLLTAETGRSIGARLLLFAATWATTILIASLSYRWIETPIIAWAKRRERPRPDLAPPLSRPSKGRVMIEPRAVS